MLELKNVSVNIEDKNILNDISIKFNKGINIIVGSNGAGKSTLLKTIVGLIDYSGSILLNDDSLDKKTIDERSMKGISYVYQNPIRFEGITVRDLFNIIKPKEDMYDEEYMKVLSNVMLDEGGFYLDRIVDNTLSGGEIKKIEIAMVLLRDTDIILLDEPESQLDFISSELIMNRLKNMNKTIIVVSHSLKSLEMADRIIELEDGSIVLDGTYDDYINSNYKKLGVIDE